MKNNLNPTLIRDVLLEVACNVDCRNSGTQYLCACFCGKKNRKLAPNICIDKSLIVVNMFRSSHRRWFVKKGVLENFTKVTGKYLCQSLLFNKKRLWHKYFPSEFCEIFNKHLFCRTSSGDCFNMFLLK